MVVASVACPARALSESVEQPLYIQQYVREDKVDCGGNLCGQLQGQNGSQQIGQIPQEPDDKEGPTEGVGVSLAAVLDQLSACVCVCVCVCLFVCTCMCMCVCFM